MIVVKIDRRGRVLGIRRDNNCEPGFQRYDDEGCLIWAVDTDDIDTAARIADEWRRIILFYNAWMDPEATRELFRVRNRKTSSASG